MRNLPAHVTHKQPATTRPQAVNGRVVDPPRPRQRHSLEFEMASSKRHMRLRLAVAPIWLDNLLHRAGVTDHEWQPLFGKLRHLTRDPRPHQGATGKGMFVGVVTVFALAGVAGLLLDLLT